MRVRIEADRLPGRDCPAGPGFPGYSGIRVGVQGKDPAAGLLDPVAADADTASWEFECRAVAKPAGPDLLGPYVQGRPGERFFYLSWVADGAGMFRRAKLMLDGVPAELLTEAVERGLLVGALGLTDPKGRPLCAAVRPPVITWSSVDRGRNS